MPSSRLSSRETCSGRLLVALILTLCPMAAWSQTASLSESIGVRVVSVDVVVTDESGTPVRGLSRDEFELFVDRRPAAIDYFSAAEDGAELREQYVLGYYPSVERGDGHWHRVRVKVGRPGFKVRTRGGYVE